MKKIENIDFNGILFIGDPHVCSKKVGRRKDDYLSSVLGKLEECAKLCNENNLRPYILGDLFHYWHDNGLRMLNRLTRVLNSFNVTPVTLEGNHDKEKTHLGEDDALELLEASGTIEVAKEFGLYETLTVSGARVNIWACPHGSPLPTELANEGVINLLTTHHDMAFGKSYMNALPLQSIKNCQMAINGHMHDTKPVEKEGDTWWVNPGNIEPLSVDLKNHVPKAWVWTPASLNAGELEGRLLPHGEDLFDLRGLQVEAHDALESVAALGTEPESAPSQFAALLKDHLESEVGRTDDASALAFDVENVLAASAASDAAQLLMRKLLGAVSAKATSS